MKYSQISKAFPFLNELKRFKFPYPLAKRLYELHKSVENEFRFVLEEERKLIDIYAAKRTDGTPNIGETGMIHFADPSDATAYSVAMSALNNAECDLKITPIILTEDVIGDISISPEMIESLSDLIIFN